MVNKRTTLLLGLFLSLAFSGCILAPMLESVHQVGATESDRQRLLPEQVKKFQEALYWGNPTLALQSATDDGRSSLLQSIKSRSRDEKIVESKIDSVDFSPNAFEADVEITERYYKVPVYMVNNRTQKQKWKFSLVTGWKIDSQVTTESQNS